MAGAAPNTPSPPAMSTAPKARLSAYSFSVASRHASEAGGLATEKADARIRTADPFITSEVLYQLSYVGATKRIAPEHWS